MLLSLNPYSNGLLSEDIREGWDFATPESLNPYSNGLLSETQDYWKVLTYLPCLNPYSNGLLSETDVCRRASSRKRS